MNSRSLAVGGILAAAFAIGCTTIVELQPQGGNGSRMSVKPPAHFLAEVAPGEFGSFEIEITGRDELVGISFLPGMGSRLDVEDGQIDEGWASGFEPGTFSLRYELVGEPPEDWDTAAPPDDGILRFYFAEHPTVDVWLEVVE